MNTNEATTTSEEQVEFIIAIGGVDVKVCYRKGYIVSFLDHFAFHSLHEPPKGIPISSTGYHSHFASPSEVEEVGGAEAYAKAYAAAVLNGKPGVTCKAQPEDDGDDYEHDDEHEDEQEPEEAAPAPPRYPEEEVRRLRNALCTAAPQPKILLARLEVPDEEVKENQTQSKEAKTMTDQKADHDPVNRPRHYNSHPSGVECITVTEHMNFNVGNAVKYLWRADLKGGLEDLKKACWYVEREIKRRQGAGEAPPSKAAEEDDGSIVIFWCVADVLEVRPDLTAEQAKEVLRKAKRNHDANLGINWEGLRTWANILFPAKGAA